MGEGESQTSAFESLLRQVARAPGYERDEQPLEPGTVIADRFEIAEEIGAGGFARVYRATDQVLSRPVAIKLLRRRRRLSDRELELFYREAQATARLNHPSIVTAYDWGEWNGQPFLVLELLDGEPLSERLPASGDAEALEIAAAIAAALEYAHARGVLHLDLKAQNVVVLDGGAIKILDFGLAGIDWDEGVLGGQRVEGGTPATMAPEQRLGGDVDGRADIWAVGVIVHQLLFGTLPPRQVAVTGELRATPPRRCAAILARTLNPSPTRRYQSASELGAAIERAAGRGRRTWSVVAAAVAAAATAATAAAAFWLGGADRPLPLSVRPPPVHRQLTFAGDVRQSDISADGERLVFLSRGNRELWVKQVDGDRPPRRLFSRPLLESPRFLPDDRRVVVNEVGASWSQWFVDTVTGEVERSPLTPSTFAVGYRDSLVRADLHSNSVSIAPLAESGRSVEYELPTTQWIYDLDVAADGSVLVASFGERGRLIELGASSLPHSIHVEEERISAARWDPEGGVYFLVGPGAFAEIKYLKPDVGERPVTVLSGLELAERLAVSASGRRLVYHRAQAIRTIERLRDSGESEPITPLTAEVTGADISADGRWLAWTVREGVVFSLHIQDLAGAGSARRLECDQPCWTPAWSPDGSSIAVRHQRRGSWTLAVVDVDSGAVRALDGVRATHDAGNPLEWLSDSELIYAPPRNEALRVVEIATGVDRPFFTGAARRGWMFRPTRSADGQRLAFFWNGGGDGRGLYVADRDGRGAAKIADGSWMPLGFEDGDARVVAVQIHGMMPSTVVAVGSVPAGGGDVEIRWRPRAGDPIADVRPIPSTGDLLLIRSEQRADAWLLESPKP